MSASSFQYAITEDGAQIAYLVVGHGFPIVFASNIWGDAHLYSSSEPYMRNLVDSLVMQGWQIVLHDGRGMGSSQRASRDFDLEARVKDLRAVVTKLQLGRFVLAAYDIAGPTAVAYTAEAPAFVSQLVLINANASTSLRRQTSPALRNLKSPGISTLEDWEFRTWTLASVDTRFRDAGMAQKVAGIFRAGMQMEAFKAYVAANAGIEVVELLPKISVPTLVVFDRIGPFGSFESSQNLAASIPDSRLVAVDDAPAAVQDFLTSAGQQLRQEPLATPLTPAQALSHRQIQVLRLLALGSTNREIADSLVLSERTVQRHIANIYDKINVRNRAEATAFAINKLGNLTN